MSKIICIVGPTGVGKSSLGIKLALETKGEIINGDAFQIYKEMNIGTAKPTLEERSLIPHHLFDYVSPTYEFSIFDYQKNLRSKIEELEKKNVNIIVVGGTGLYLKSGFYDFNLSEQEEHIDMSSYENKSNEELHKILEEIDEVEASKIHQNNRKRVLRAIQIYLETGNKKSDIIASQDHVPLYDVTFIGLTRDREELYDLINKRVDKMFELGLVDEVKDLMKKYPSTLRSFQAIGYKELMTGLKENKDEEEIKELIKKNSRNYAKRQFTYFNNQLDVKWFSSSESALDYALKILGRR